jgi:hypothetical protein
MCGETVGGVPRTTGKGPGPQVAWDQDRAVATSGVRARLRSRPPVRPGSLQGSRCPRASSWPVRARARERERNQMSESDSNTEQTIGAHLAVKYSGDPYLVAVHGFANVCKRETLAGLCLKQLGADRGEPVERFSILVDPLLCSSSELAMILWFGRVETRLTRAEADPGADIVGEFRRWTDAVQRGYCRSCFYRELDR